MLDLGFGIALDGVEKEMTRVGPDPRRMRFVETCDDKLDLIVAALGDIGTRLEGVECAVRAGQVYPDRLYGRRAVARLLGLSVRTVDRRVREGRLDVVRRGRSVRIVGASLLRFHQEREVKSRVLVNRI